jgi:hypothetical protein
MCDLLGCCRCGRGCGCGRCRRVIVLASHRLEHCRKVGTLGARRRRHVLQHRVRQLGLGAGEHLANVDGARTSVSHADRLDGALHKGGLGLGVREIVAVQLGVRKEALEETSAGHDGAHNVVQKAKRRFAQVLVGETRLLKQRLQLLLRGNHPRGRILVAAR